MTIDGSMNSHTAILARTMGIPALVCASVPLDDTIDGRLGIVDGVSGVLYVEPDEETLAQMKEKQAQQEQEKPDPDADYMDDEDYGYQESEDDRKEDDLIGNDDTIV